MLFCPICGYDELYFRPYPHAFACACKPTSHRCPCNRKMIGQTSGGKSRRLVCQTCRDDELALWWKGLENTHIHTIAARQALHRTRQALSHPQITQAYKHIENTRTHTHKHKHAHTHAKKDTHIRIHIHSLTLSHTHPLSLTHTPHTRKRTHTYSHTHTHTHTHT